MISVDLTWSWTTWKLIRLCLDTLQVAYRYAEEFEDDGQRLRVRNREADGKGLNT